MLARRPLSQSVLRAVALPAAFALGWAGYAILHSPVAERGLGFSWNGPGAARGAGAASASAAAAGKPARLRDIPDVPFSVSGLLASVDPVEELAALEKHLKKASAGECRELMAALILHSDKDAARRCSEKIAERWVALEPEAAVEFVEALDPAVRSPEGIYGPNMAFPVYSAWARREPAAVLRHGGKGMSLIVQEALVEENALTAHARWRESAPADWKFETDGLTLALCANSQRLTGHAGDLLQLIADRGGERTADKRIVSEAWSERDPEGFRQWALHDAKGEARKWALSDLTAEMPERMREMLDSGDLAEDGRWPVAEKLASLLAATDPLAALELCRKYGGDQTDAAIGDLLYNKCALPAEQITRVLTETNPEALDGVLTAAMREPGNRAAALAWLRAHPGKSAPPHALGAFPAMSAAEWGSVLPYFQNGDDSQERELGDAAGRKIGDDWKEHAVPTLASEISALPPSLQRAAFQGLVEEFSDFSKAEQLFAAMPGDLRASSAAWMARRSLDFSPESAGAVLLQSPASLNEPAAAALCERTAAAWVEQDALAASEWITRLPSGEARDSAAAVLVEAIAADDPDSAARWAETIQDPVSRQRAMVALTPPP